jgi:hypothetical protein
MKINKDTAILGYIGQKYNITMRDFGYDFDKDLVTKGYKIYEKGFYEGIAFLFKAEKEKRWRNNGKR